MELETIVVFQKILTSYCSFLQHLYKDSWEKHKATGYSLPPDSVPLRHAKHSDNVQSEVKSFYLSKISQISNICHAHPS